MSIDVPLLSDGHASTVWSISFEAGGKRLVSVSDDKTVKIWQAYEPGNTQGMFLQMPVSNLRRALFKFVTLFQELLQQEMTRPGNACALSMVFMSEQYTACHGRIHCCTQLLNCPDDF